MLPSELLEKIEIEGNGVNHREVSGRINDKIAHGAAELTSRLQEALPADVKSDFNLVANDEGQDLNQTFENTFTPSVLP